jgi:hypothetical protein
MDQLNFREIWCVDFQYDRPSGENPCPKALDALDIRSGRRLFVDGPELIRGRSGPIPTGPDAVVVTFGAPALFGCFLSLGWDLPQYVIDLEAEFRWHVSGLNEARDWSFEKAVDFYGAEAAAHRTDTLANLLKQMLPVLDPPHALLRGRYTEAVAHMERIGIPIDTDMLAALRANWWHMKGRLIERVDRDYGVFDGCRFRPHRWRQRLDRRGIAWPTNEEGRLKLDKETFKFRARCYPREIEPMRTLRRTLSCLREIRLAVGADARNRAALRPFASKTGRNQPSSSEFIFGCPSWMQGLIKPEPGMALAYVDYEQQEFGIAAALSGDQAMGEAYESCDPYLSLVKQCGAVPSDATKESDADVREQFKMCVLGIQYGIAAGSLAIAINGSKEQADELIEQHHRVFRRYWDWSNTMARDARKRGVISSVYGWRLNIRENTKPTTIRNFPLQSNAAEILRLACCELIDRGISVCAPVHDAVLIEASLDEIEDAVDACSEIMVEASCIVLDGFPLRTEARIVRYPDTLLAKKGQRFWKEVQQLMEPATT